MKTHKKKGLLAIAVLAIATILIWNIQLGFGFNKNMIVANFAGIHVMATENCDNYTPKREFRLCKPPEEPVCECTTCDKGSSSCTPTCTCCYNPF